MLFSEVVEPPAGGPWPSLQDGSAHTLQSVSRNRGGSRTHNGARAVPARRGSTIKAARVRSLLPRQKAASASRDGSRSVSFCKTSYVGQNVQNIGNPVGIPRRARHFAGSFCARFRRKKLSLVTSTPTGPH